MDTSTITEPEGARTVTALMIFTVIFALIGNEINHRTESGSHQTEGAITSSGRILLGGFVATTLLVLATHAGEAGRELGVGLSVVAFATATLVYGKPVWDAMNSAFGSKPTTGLGTAPTTPTTPSANLGQSVPTIATNLA